MALEFIDVTRDEMDERSRVRNTAVDRRGSKAGSRRPAGNTDQKISSFEEQRQAGAGRRRTAEPGRRGQAGAGELTVIGFQGQKPAGQGGSRANRPERRRPAGTDGPEVINPARQRRPGPDRRRASGPEGPGSRNTGRRPRPVNPEIQRQRERRRRQRRRKALAARMAVMLFFVALIASSGFLLVKLITGSVKKPEQTQKVFNSTVQRKEVIRANETVKPAIKEDFLTVNEYSRPGEALPKVNNIFVHYTANPGTSAAQNRSYFENLGITGETSASAHFVIGFEGEIIQCIPLDEIAYAVMQRNYDSISIECCYLSEDGKFTDATYQSLIQLCGWLLKEYRLAPEDMRRHYDEGGKKCPLYYVEHEDAWEKFLNDLEQYIMKTQA